MALLSLLTSGCVAIAATEWYGTSFVAPSPFRSVDLPAAGEDVSVRVEDMRTGVAGYEIGSKLTSTWGYEASTIDLKDKSLLANCIAQDVLAMLRQRGYRSVLMDAPAGGATEVALTVRVHVFSLIVSEGDRMDGDALVSFEAIALASGRRVGLDAVGVRVGTMKKAFGGDYQALFDLLYQRLRDELAKRIPLAITPPLTATQSPRKTAPSRP